MLKPQGVTDGDIFSATQTTATEKRDKTGNFSKRSSKVNRVIDKPAGSEFDCSDPENSKCGQESR